MSDGIISAGVSWADALGAISTTVAILAGFGYAMFDRRNESIAASLAASQVSKRAVDFLTERLAVLVRPSPDTKFALRGIRTSEMIEILREIDLSKVSPEKLEMLAVIRSTVFAINSRIDEVLKDDASRQSERTERLKVLHCSLVSFARSSRC